MKAASKKLLTDSIIRNRHTKNSLGLSAHEARRKKLGKSRIANALNPKTTTIADLEKEGKLPTV